MRYYTFSFLVATAITEPVPKPNNVTGPTTGKFLDFHQNHAVLCCVQDAFIGQEFPWGGTIPHVSMSDGVPTIDPKFYITNSQLASPFTGHATGSYSKFLQASGNRYQQVFSFLIEHDCNIEGTPVQLSFHAQTHMFSLIDGSVERGFTDFVTPSKTWSPEDLAALGGEVEQSDGDFTEWNVTDCPAPVMKSPADELRYISLWATCNGRADYLRIQDVYEEVGKPVEVQPL